MSQLWKIVIVILIVLYILKKTRNTETRQPHAKDPYEILGIHPGASKQEIQAAHRKLVQQYHPDKVAHLGQEFQDLAREKFVEIQDAYDYLIEK